MSRLLAIPLGIVAIIAAAHGGIALAQGDIVGWLAILVACWITGCAVCVLREGA